MKTGVEEIIPNASISIRPLSDGGTGFAKLLTDVTKGEIEDVVIKGPLYENIRSYFGILGGDRDTAVIESATAAGLFLVPKRKRNPLNTSTYGVGQLIFNAVEKGFKKIIVGCGDSATNDCGLGCATALGVKFYDSNSKYLGFPKGSDLPKISFIDYENAARKFSNIDITIACNLTSVLCGPEGTSLVYAPQKGAKPEQAEILHKGTKHFVDLVYKKCGIDLSFIPGAGGAGGLASSLYAFFGARLLYSIDVVDRYVFLDKYLSKANLVLTGEGRIDDRTATGKIACGVALKAKKYNLPVIAIVGSMAQDHEDIYYNGIDAVESISEGPMLLKDSMANAKKLIQRATTRVMRFVFKVPRF
jgi:glycerate kinase